MSALDRLSDRSLALALMGGGAVVIAVASRIERAPFFFLPGIDGAMTMVIVATALLLLDGTTIRRTLAIVLSIMALEATALYATHTPLLAPLGIEALGAGALALAGESIARRRSRFVAKSVENP